MAIAPARGEIWIAQLDPVRGHEQAGRLPVLILSTTRFSQGPAGLVTICPLTRTVRAWPSRILVDPPDGGVRDRSYVICEQVRTIAHERLTGGPLGIIAPTTMAQVEVVVRALLEL